jgi:hypothetical protein
LNKGKINIIAVIKSIIPHTFLVDLNIIMGLKIIAITINKKINTDFVL